MPSAPLASTAVLPSRFDSLKVSRHDLRLVFPRSLQNAKEATRTFWRATEAVACAMDPGNAANKLRIMAKEGLKANQWSEGEPLTEGNPTTDHARRFTAALIAIILSTGSTMKEMAAKRNAMQLARNREEEAIIVHCCACNDNNNQPNNDSLVRVGLFIAALAAAEN